MARWVLWSSQEDWPSQGTCQCTGGGPVRSCLNWRRPPAHKRNQPGTASPHPAAVRFRFVIHPTTCAPIHSSILETKAFDSLRTSAAVLGVAAAATVRTSGALCPPTVSVTSACDGGVGLLSIPPGDAAAGTCRGYCLTDCVAIRPQACGVCSDAYVSSLPGGLSVCCDEAACDAACGAPSLGCRYGQRRRCSVLDMWRGGQRGLQSGGYKGMGWTTAVWLV